MIRITEIELGGARTLLRIEGNLTADTSSNLERVAEAGFAAHPRALELDASGVVFADRKGVELLRSLVWSGARLVRCSALVSELMSTAEAEARDGGNVWGADGPCSSGSDDRLERLRIGDE